MIVYKVVLKVGDHYESIIERTYPSIYKIGGTTNRTKGFGPMAACDTLERAQQLRGSAFYDILECDCVVSSDTEFYSPAGKASNWIEGTILVDEVTPIRSM